MARQLPRLSQLLTDASAANSFLLRLVLMSIVLTAIACSAKGAKPGSRQSPAEPGTGPETSSAKAQSQLETLLSANFGRTKIERVSSSSAATPSPTARAVTAPRGAPAALATSTPGASVPKPT